LLKAASPIYELLLSLAFLARVVRRSLQCYDDCYRDSIRLSVTLVIHV